jgi:hypothetical protein
MATEDQRLERLERADLFALQQVAENMRETNTNLRALTTEVTNLGREVSALTAQNLKGEIDEMQVRLKALEEKQQLSKGGQDLWNWVLLQLPWLVGFGSLLWAFITHKDKAQ